MVFPRCRSSQNARAHRESHRLQRRSPAGRHHALRKRAERPALLDLRPRPLLRQTRKRRPPFPHALKRIPRRRRNRKPEGLAAESQSTQRLRIKKGDPSSDSETDYPRQGFAGAGTGVAAGADDLLKSKLTLGPQRAASSSLK